MSEKEFDKNSRNCSSRVGCFGKICTRKSIVRVKPAVQRNQTDHVTDLTFNIPKNTDPVVTVHSALTDHKPKTKPTKEGAKRPVNKNNNNDEDGKGSRRHGNPRDLKGSSHGEREVESGRNDQQTAPSTDVFYNGLSVTDGDSSSNGPSPSGADQGEGRLFRLPHLTNPFRVFQRRRRDQEEILHELQREGIVADPRITVGGVAYELPVANRRGRQCSVRLDSDVVGLLRREREKEKRRLLELKIKMCRAQERRDQADRSKLERILENQDKLRLVREKMEYDEDLKIRQTNINIIKKLTKGATNREARDREKRWKMETRRRHREQIRITRKMKGTGSHRKRYLPEDAKDNGDSRPY